MNTNFSIKQKFGFNKGALSVLSSQLLFKLGADRRCRNIGFTKVNRLIFLYSENNGRILFAEMVVRKHGVKCMTFGFGDRVIEMGCQIQLDLYLRVSQTLSSHKSAASDMFVVMDPFHLRLLPESLRDGVVTFMVFWLQASMAYLYDSFNTSFVCVKRCERIIKKLSIIWLRS